MFRRSRSGRTPGGISYRIRAHLYGPTISGPTSRVRVSPSANLSNVVINTIGGFVDIGEHVFFGYDVLLLTGTHDFRETGLSRQANRAVTDRNILIEAGAWIASRVIIIGPCRIGTNAVIGSGCVIDFDVPGDTVVRVQQQLSTDLIRYRDDLQR